MSTVDFSFDHYKFNKNLLVTKCIIAPGEEKQKHGRSPCGVKKCASLKQTATFGWS
jgi:hypothetical protein